MTFQPHASIGFPPSSPYERTPLSREFEAFYRALPKDGLVPHRRAFRPEKATRFLRHITLCELRLSATPAIHVRLVGSAIEEEIQHSITGHDFLSYLSEGYRSGAIETARLMLSRPCGLWQITPFHYMRGYGHDVEVTAFPLSEGDGISLILVLMQPLGTTFGGPATGGKPLIADTARDYCYIDLGAGLPG
ncbi:MAG TPA: hypothetical protein VMU08_09085 [Rhizomicrobium sp.]|nr:hypothetical protein [Rhizomicrobium sp.]